jgi:isoleucyl-tRNA synthetase
LWNSWYFFQLYANAAGYEASSSAASGDLLDRYLLAKLRQFAETVQWQLDHYEVVTAMDRTRDVCSVAASLRKANGLRVRLPLSELTVVAADAGSLADRASA